MSRCTSAEPSLRSCQSRAHAHVIMLEHLYMSCCRHFPRREHPSPGEQTWQCAPCDGENLSLRYGPLMRYNLLGQGWTSLIRQDPANIPQKCWCTLTWRHHSVGAHLSATHPWWKCPSLTASRGALLDWDLVTVEDLKITNNQNNQRMGTQPFLCSNCQFIWKRTLSFSGSLQLHWGLSSFFCLHYSNNTDPTFQRNVERHLSKTST